MGFDEALEYVLRDERSHIVPILFVVQILIICEDNHLFKEAEDVRKLLSTREPDKLGARRRRSKGVSVNAKRKHCSNG